MSEAPAEIVHRLSRSAGGGEHRLSRRAGFRGVGTGRRGGAGGGRGWEEKGEGCSRTHLDPFAFVSGAAAGSPAASAVASASEIVASAAAVGVPAAFVAETPAAARRRARLEVPIVRVDVLVLVPELVRPSSGSTLGASLAMRARDHRAKGRRRDASERCRSGGRPRGPGGERTEGALSIVADVRAAVNMIRAREVKVRAYPRRGRGGGRARPTRRVSLWRRRRGRFHDVVDTGATSARRRQHHIILLMFPVDEPGRCASARPFPLRRLRAIRSRFIARRRVSMTPTPPFASRARRFRRPTRLATSSSSY